MKPKPEEVDPWPEPKRPSLRSEVIRVQGYFEAAIEVGKYLDKLADKGNRKANRLSEGYPEEVQLRTLETEVLRRLKCKHPVARCQELKKHFMTACVECCQVLRRPSRR